MNVEYTVINVHLYCSQSDLLLVVTRGYLFVLPVQKYNLKDQITYEESILYLIFSGGIIHKKCIILLITAIYFFSLYKLYQYLEASIAEDNQISSPPRAYPPYKIYIYDLPSSLNEDLYTEMEKSKDVFTPIYNHGFGKRWYRDTLMTVRNTWQFSLEMIIHSKLKESPYRTLKPDEAQVFYVPFYGAINSLLVGKKYREKRKRIDQVFNYLSNSEYFKQNKTHVMTFGRIEREHLGLFTHKLANRLTYIGIEKELNPATRRRYFSDNVPYILVPYPSYGHFYPNTTEHMIQNVYENEDRDVFILYAGGQRRTDVRGHILDQTRSHTRLGYESFKQKYNQSDAFKHGLHYLTQEYRQNRHTISWMRRSVFCLQPPGDSPTRKSFYDAVVSGCIPVLFSMNLTVKYPFHPRFNHNDFTVTIDTDKVLSGVPIYDMLSMIDKDTIRKKQESLYSVMLAYQYSYPVTSGRHRDAMQYILDKIGELYGLL